MDIPVFTTPCPPPCRSRTTLLFPLRMSNIELTSHLHLQKTRLPPLTNYGQGGLRLNAVSCSKIENINDIWSDSQCVEVIGIGSKVDSVLESCLSSPSPLRSLRLWSAIPGMSLRGKLQLRLHGNDGDGDNLDVPQDLQSHFKAFVLVASAGYGDEHITVTDILRTIKSACGLAVVIVLNPFSFEGLRRQDEVRILLEKLQDFVNFSIEINIDALLKRDSVTLEEALKTMNRAICFALNAVSILVSDCHKKHMNSPHGIMKELTVAELINVLEGYAKGRIGFGVGYSIESSIMQAVRDCPFFMGLEERNGIIICIFSGANAVESNDVYPLVHTFRQVTGCTQEIIISRVGDPDMKINSIATTVIALECVEKTSKQKINILSRLVERFPFFCGFLRNHSSQLDVPLDICSTGNSSLHHTRSYSVNKTSDIFSDEGANVDCEKQCSEPQMLLHDDSYDIYPLRGYCDGKAYGYGYNDAGTTQICNKQKVEESATCLLKPSNSWNFGVGENMSQNFMDKGDTQCEDVPISDNPSIYGLPVGVRTSDHLYSNISNSGMDFHPKLEDDISAQALDKPGLSSRIVLADEGVTGLPYYASTPPRGKNAVVPKKLGVLSVRAASMLEAERDSTRRLSPIIEIGYRGGIYMGHCQGGLPEGMGRLTFPDGSSYDGMWRNGKRSGLGRFCFYNGDVFHGSWRSDLIHGKGWFYFHTEDRWFANFWKGKANGEGRFYSKLGDVLFGHFQDGWRHGRFLCVRKNGTRYVEIWNEGVLESSEPLELDAGGVDCSWL
ncbi:hypothetical protein Dimus_017003 [Dionaea muscipula]